MKNLLLSTFAALLTLVLFAGGLAFCSFLGLGMAAAGSVPYVPERCILTLDLSQPVSERVRRPAPLDVLSGAAAYPLAAHEIAAARGIEQAELERLARERGWLTPEEALAAGLVTRVAPFEELLGRLRELTDAAADEEVAARAEDAGGALLSF